jgi:rod shape-determining protein MreD
MAVKTSSPAAPPWVSNGIGRLLPVATTGVAALLSILPVHAPGYAALSPAFTLMALYHWTVYRPDLLPPSGLFAIGLAQDLLGGGPVGVGALTLLIARAAVLRGRRHLVSRDFPVVWAGFLVLSLATMLALWGVHCVLALSWFDVRNTVFRTALTVAIFPAASVVMGRSQRALIGAG